MFFNYLKLNKKEIVIFTLIIVFFIFSRFFNILAFPIFNDESIYLQYSQLVNQDFAKFKFISVDNVFKDFKPPLQYWWGAPFLPLFDNPLTAGRFASVSFSIFGLIGIYFLCLNLWGRREAIVAALFYTLSPPILFYSTQFVAEVYVFSAAALLFAVAIKIIERPTIKLLSLGVLFGSAILLFKQAGALYLYLLLLLPLFYAFPLLKAIIQKKKEAVNRAETKYEKKLKVKAWSENKKTWFKNSLAILAVAVSSFVVYRIIIPSELISIGKNFTGRWTLSLSEIIKLPIDVWVANFNLVKDFFSHSYTLWAFLAIIVFLVVSLIKREKKNLMILALFLAASAAVIFGLRGFNEYIYNTAVIIFLIPILARLAVFGFFEFNFSTNKILINISRGAIFLILIALTINWSYQIFLMKTAPIKYLERGSEWMVGNYLTGWANGFNVPDIVNFLAGQEDKTIALVDPQWGNPGTALQVFQEKFYPQVVLVPITTNLLIGELKAEIEKAGFKNKFAIFSAQGNAQELRNQWQGWVEQNLCDEKLEFKKYPLQTPVILCKF